MLFIKYLKHKSQYLGQQHHKGNVSYHTLYLMLSFDKTAYNYTCQSQAIYRNHAHFATVICIKPGAGGAALILEI